MHNEWIQALPSPWDNPHGTPDEGAEGGQVSEGTKERWSAGPESPILIHDSQKYTVCTMPGPWGNEWCERNARLIMAAPDLLAACEAMIRWHEDPDASDDCIAQARDAIAKAKGENDV